MTEHADAPELIAAVHPDADATDDEIADELFDLLSASLDDLDEV